MDVALPPGQEGSDPVADLARCDLLAGTSHERLRALAALFSPGTAEAGTVLLRRGAVPDRFLFLTGGRATVRFGTHPGEKPVELPAGSIVGEVALLRGRPHKATVTAATDVRFLVGDAGAFAQLLAVPDVGRRLVRQARQRWAADLPPVSVPLRGGGTVRLRPMIPADAAAVIEHPERSSRESRYRRFLRPAPSERDLRHLADADYDDHFAWAALDDRAVPVAEASYFRLPPDGTEAEISFWLADDVQGLGLGGLMLGALAVAATEHGITRFSSDVLADNATMRTILERAGVCWMSEEYGVVHGIGPVPDPGRFGIDQRTAGALRSLVREVWLRPERAAVDRPSL